jgi:hypothetical protein
VPAIAQQNGPLLEPPIVIGHEEQQDLLQNTGIPSVGWVVGLRRRGVTLYSDLSPIFPSIARLIQIGAYKHVSPEIYARDQPPEGVPAKGCMLRRLAFLGGQLPHLKSLADLPADAWERGKGKVITDVPIFEAGEWQGENYSLSDLDDMVLNFERFSKPTNRFAELSRVAGPRVRLTHFRRVWQDSSRTWLCFSEVTAMADDAVQQVAEAAIMQSFPGLPQEFVASLTPDQMGMLATAIAPAAPEAPVEGDTTGMAEWPADAPSKEAVIAALVAQGEDQATLMAMSDEELVALYQQKMGGAAPLSESEEFEEVPTVAGAAVSTPTRRQPQKVTTTQQFAEQLAELNRGLTAAQRQLTAVQREQRQRARLDRIAEENKKKSAVRAFCEQLSKSGKASPAEVEFDQKTGEPLGALAFALSAASAVRKFSEGKDAKSDLEVLMEKLEARPVRRFGEQVADPLRQTTNFSERVEKHYEGRLKRINGRAGNN